MPTLVGAGLGEGAEAVARDRLIGDSYWGEVADFDDFLERGFGHESALLLLDEANLAGGGPIEIG